MPRSPSRLAGLRRSYDGAGLEPADLAAGWRRQLDRWLADAIGAGLDEPNAMSLATVDAGGMPSVRTVLLKGVDDAGLIFFTNLGSRKGIALQANPKAAAAILWAPLARQVCVTGIAEQVSRAETAAYVRSRPRGSQLGAWTSPQSQVLADRAELESMADRVRSRFPAGEPVPVPEFWGGFRLRPLTVEFWQGGRDRLHDRLRFRRSDDVPGPADDGAWVLERLAP